MSGCSSITFFTADAFRNLSGTAAMLWGSISREIETRRFRPRRGCGLRYFGGT